MVVKNTSSVLNITIHPERKYFVKNETKANGVSDKLKVTKSISGPAGIVQQTQWYAGKCLTTSSPLYPIEHPNVVLTSDSSVQSPSCV